MQKLDELDKASLRDDIPAFRAGDNVKVHVKVIEGNRSRIQVFQGYVIGRQGHGVGETFRGAAPADGTVPEGDAARSPETMRSMMSAMQRGWQRGRQEAADVEAARDSADQEDDTP